MSDDSTRATPRWLPHPLVIHVIVLGIVLYASYLRKGPWDSDFYWHLPTGRLIAEGMFPRTDPYSFTWGGMPWTLHEWLGELFLFQLVDKLDYMGAVYVYGLIPPITVAILVFALHKLGLRTAAVIGASTLSALLIIPYATIRPQAVSWIFFALLIGGLIHLRPERARWTLLLVPLFIAWANLHGLWVIGLVVLVAYAAMTLAGMTPMSRAKGWALAMIPLAMLGVVFTPEGPALLLYPFRYVDSGDWGLANITEWQSPDFHDPAHIPLLIFIGAIAIFGRWRVPWWMSILAFMGIAMTLLALRNGPIAAIIGVPALAVGMDAALHDWRPTVRTFSPRVAVQRRMLEVGLAVIVAVAGWIILAPPDPAGAVRASIERELPVQGVELLRERVSDGRIATWYGWGGYVIGEMTDDGARVLVDGRNDMYSEGILNEYNRVKNAEPGWEAIIDGYDVDALLFPPSEPITKGPAEDAGWCEAFRDDNEVVYLRSCD